MAMDSAEIGVSMGFNGTKVTDGLKDVTSKTKDLNKEMNQTAEAVGKLGLVAGAFSLFGAAIKEVFDYSKNLTGALNENERAARDAARAATSLFSEIKTGALSAGANVIGVANSFGEFLGKASVNALSFFGIMSEGAARNLEEAERITEQERLRGEYMAKNAAAFKAISEGLKKVTDESAAFDRAEMSSFERRTLAQRELAEIQKQMANADLTTLERRKLELAEAQKMLELKREDAKVASEQEKKDAAKAKLLKEANDAAEKAAREKAKADKEAYDLGLEFYKLEEEVRAKMQEQEAEKRRVVAAEAHAVNEAQENALQQENIAKGIEGQNVELTKQGEILTANSKIPAPKGKITGPQGNLNQYGLDQFYDGSIGSKGSVTSVSDYELNQQYNANSARLNELRQKQAESYSSSTYYFDILLAEQALKTVVDEVAARKESAKIAEKAAKYDEEKGLGTQSATRALIEQLSTLKEIDGVKRGTIEIDTRAVIAADNILNRQQSSLDAIKEAVQQRKEEAPAITITANAAQAEAIATTTTAEAVKEAVTARSVLRDLGEKSVPTAQSLTAFEITKTTEIKTQNSLLEDQATRIRAYAVQKAQEELALEKRITSEMQTRQEAQTALYVSQAQQQELANKAALRAQSSSYRGNEGIASRLEEDLMNAAYQVATGADPTGYYAGKISGASANIASKVESVKSEASMFGYDASAIVSQLQQLNDRLNANGLRVDGNT